MIEQIKPIGILGGTFDPVHFGHLRPALELLDKLELTEIRFIPAGQPPHRRQPAASAAQRLAMLERAIIGQPGFVLDDREMRRTGPSFMVDTLESLRTQFGTAQPLCLILGSDAFAELESWHRWDELLELTHLVVQSRPGTGLASPATLADMLKQRRLDTAAALRNRPGGGILLQTVTALEISATAIRQLLAEGHSPRYLLPEAVRCYIEESGLYRFKGRST